MTLEMALAGLAGKSPSWRRAPNGTSVREN